MSNENEFEQMELPHSFNIIQLPEIVHNQQLLDNAHQILQTFVPNNEMRNIDTWMALVHALSENNENPQWQSEDNNI